MSTTRREFLSTAAAATAFSAYAHLGLGQAAGPNEPAISDIPELKTPESTKEGDMLFRTFANTKEKISLLGLGGHSFADPGQAEATRLLRKAVDSGVNFMDNCWDYRGGDSETFMGNALKDGYRKKVFLMTKIDGQTKSSAEAQLNESLRRLQTDVIDLLQIHEVVRNEDPDRAFAKDGSIEALTAAQKAGKIRFIGFTGHKDPAMHMKMLDVAAKNNFRFDSSQFPLSILDAHFKSFARILVPRMVKDKIAVLAMKTNAGGGLLGGAGFTAVECFNYAMTLPASTVIRGMTSVAQLDENLAAVKNFKPLAKDEMAALLARSKTLALSRNTPERFKTSTAYDGTARRPDWLGIQ